MLVFSIFLDIFLYLYHTIISFFYPDDKCDLLSEANKIQIPTVDVYDDFFEKQLKKSISIIPKVDSRCLEIIKKISSNKSRFRIEKLYNNFYESVQHINVQMKFVSDSLKSLLHEQKCEKERFTSFYNVIRENIIELNQYDECIDNYLRGIN